MLKWAYLSSLFFGPHNHRHVRPHRLPFFGTLEPLVWKTLIKFKVVLKGLTCESWTSLEVSWKVWNKFYRVLRKLKKICKSVIRVWRVFSRFKRVTITTSRRTNFARYVTHSVDSKIMRCTSWVVPSQWARCSSGPASGGMSSHHATDRPIWPHLESGRCWKWPGCWEQYWNFVLYFSSAVVCASKTLTNIKTIRS